LLLLLEQEDLDSVLRHQVALRQSLLLVLDTPKLVAVAMGIPVQEGRDDLAVAVEAAEVAMVVTEGRRQ
jgi:hypothetical protein